MLRAPFPLTSGLLRERLRSSAGVTLVELLVALFLLGIIFSAVANVLTTSLRAVVVQERRVEATSLMTQLHEQFQSLAWDDAAVYEHEVPELVDAGLALTGVETGEVPRFEGLPIVIRPEDAARRPTVPASVSLIANESGRTEFEVVQVVTWSQGEGESDRPRKRLTTIMRWQVFDREFEQRLSSERAPIGGGFEDPRRPVALQYILSPTTLPLDGEGRPTQPLFVSVTFSRGMASADLRFNALGGTGEEPHLVAQSMALTPPTVIDSDARGITFTQTLDLSSFTFPDGPRLFTVVGMLGSQEVEATGLVEMVGGPYDGLPDSGGADPLDDDPAGPVTEGEEGDGEESDGEESDGEEGDATGGSTLVVDSATVGPTAVRVGRSTDQLCEPIQIEATISGLDLDTDFQVLVQWADDERELALQSSTTAFARFSLELSGQVNGLTGSTPDREFTVSAVQGRQDVVRVAGTVSFRDLNDVACGAGGRS